MEELKRSDNEEKYQKLAHEMVKKLKINDDKCDIDELILKLKESKYYQFI